MPVLDTAAIAQAAADAPPPRERDAKGRSSRGVNERRDRVPKASATTRAKSAAATTRGERMSKETTELGGAIGQLLSLPGALFGMAGEPFLGDRAAVDENGHPIMRRVDVPGGEPVHVPVVIPGHFSKTGPALGVQLAKASETNPALRRFLKNAMAGDSFALLMMGAIAYAAPPLVYILTPNSAPIRGTLGVPPRPRKAKSAPHSEPPEDTETPEAEPGTPEG